MPPGPVRAAGAALWRTTPASGLEVALIHRPKYDDWSLPKGKLERGEHVLAAAVREVEEETGLRVELGRRLPTLHYDVDGRPKSVDYWAAQVRTAGGEADEGFTPNAEVDELRWLAVGEACAQLSRARDARVLEALLAGPLSTVPVVLLRHASSVRRSEWSGDELTRPLLPRGEAQASALVDLLAAYGVERIISSDTARCQDTVRPYAGARRLTIEAEPVFSESGYKADRDAATRLAVGLLSSDRPTVLCSHRPVLPELVSALCRRSGLRPPHLGLETAACWVLHVADGRVVSWEQHGLD